MPDNDQYRVLLRLAPDLGEEVRIAALATGQSINTWIAAAIEAALDATADAPELIERARALQTADGKALARLTARRDRPRQVIS